MSHVIRRAAISDWLHALASEDRALAWLELRQDRGFPRINPDERIKAIDFALAEGTETARPFLDRDVFGIADSLGVRVCVNLGPNEIAGSLMRAEYDVETRTIILYQRSVDAADQMLDGAFPRIPELYLAHELFHHLAAYSQAYPLSRLSPGDGKKISRRYEIAAHAFARLLTGFPALPNILDSLLLIERGLLTPFQWDGMWRAARTAVGEHEPYALKLSG